MIYLKGGGITVVVLETANLDEIRKGRPARTPDGSVVIAWTPDPVWLADRILNTDGDAAAISRLIEEAAGRPEKPAPRPYHKPHGHLFSPLTPEDEALLRGIEGKGPPAPKED